MLCQLVCTDRRYARMNCFNIRELQSILKNKFFTDLVNSHDHRELLNQSMIGLRFKQNSNVSLDLDITSFYKYGLHHGNMNKNYRFSSNNTTLSNKSLSNLDILLLDITNTSFTVCLSNFTYTAHTIYSELLSLFYSFLSPSFISFNFLNYFFKTFSINFNMNNISQNKFNFGSNNNSVNTNLGTLNTGYKLNNDNLTMFTESSNSQRITRFNTVFINYDYKTGHYLGN
jgi:hypothetical protein